MKREKLGFSLLPFIDLVITVKEAVLCRIESRKGYDTCTSRRNRAGGKEYGIRENFFAYLSHVCETVLCRNSVSNRKAIRYEDGKFVLIDDGWS